MIDTVGKRAPLGWCSAFGMTLASLAASAALASTADGAWLGVAPAAQRLALILPLKVDGAGLERLAMQVSDPLSSLYGHYQSIPTLARHFGASAAIRRRVIGYLRAHGATDVRIDATGLFAEATMNIGLAGRLFAAPLERFRADDGSTYVAPALQTRIPSVLAGAVTGIVGLDTRPLVNRVGTPIRRAPDETRARASAQQTSELPRTGTAAGCTAGQAAGGSGSDPTTAAFTPNQYLTAYDFDPLHKAGYLGQGQRVALIELDGVDRPDVATFAQCFGLPMPNINEYRVGLAGAPPPALETTLDLDVLAAGAPALSAIDVYETSSDDAAFIKALTAPLQNPARKPSVISISLGICDDLVNQNVDNRTVETTDFALDEATISGATVLAAAGDAGSTECTSSSGLPLFDPSLGLGGVAVEYPTTSPAVFAVGGTNLALAPSNQIANQVVWNDAPVRLAAGGGGFSDTYDRPPWQVPSIPASVGVLGQRPQRAVPDVAMLADVRPGYAIYCSTADCAGSGPWIAAGGTSAATPLLGGGIALVDQVLGARNRVPVGNPASWLYFEAEALAPRSFLFRDVTAGSNDISAYLQGSGGRSVGCCAAAPGYDEASGWGSVDVDHLAEGYLQAELPNDHVRVTVKLPPKQRPVSSGRILVTVSCSTDCYMYAYVFVTIGRGQLTPGGVRCRTAPCFELHSRRPTYQGSAASRTFSFRFTRAELGMLRSALRTHARILATAFGEVADPRAVLTVIPKPVTVFYKQSRPAVLKIIG